MRPCSSFANISALERRQLEDEVRQERTAIRARSRAVVAVLRAQRDQLRWSQAELAKRSGIGQDTIRAIGQGKHPNLAFFTVARWARVVGASLEELEALSAGGLESSGQG
jgi:DNA-binding XRE family transcriptional regulator